MYRIQSISAVKRDIHRLDKQLQRVSRRTILLILRMILSRQRLFRTNLRGCGLITLSTRALNTGSFMRFTEKNRLPL